MNWTGESENDLNQALKIAVAALETLKVIFEQDEKKVTYGEDLGPAIKELKKHIEC